MLPYPTLPYPTYYFHLLSHQNDRVDPVTMQYVRNISDSVSTAWNSLNPATLSGAIDVIVVEQED